MLLKLLFVLAFFFTPLMCDYNSDFVALAEYICGEGYLSHGGPKLLKRMLEGENLENKKLLDIGCGIGGPSVYIAEHHPVELIGIDPDPYMIDRCCQLLASTKEMKGKASFTLMENPLTLEPLQNESFDMVISREALLNIPNEQKKAFFEEVFRVLKPGGTIIFYDWMHQSPNYGPELTAMLEMDDIPYHLLKPAEYTKTLNDAGFCHVTIADLSDLLETLSQECVDRIANNRQHVIDQFGEDAYTYSLQSWTYQTAAFQKRELLAGIIKATVQH